MPVPSLSPLSVLLLDKNLGGPDHARLLWRLPQEPEYLGRKIYDEFYAPLIREMTLRVRRFCPWDDELSISWHIHIMSSIFHATLGKYVTRLELHDKEPWMKDQDRIPANDCRYGGPADFPSGSFSGGRGKTGVTAGVECNTREGASFLTLLPVFF